MVEKKSGQRRLQHALCELLEKGLVPLVVVKMVIDPMADDVEDAKLNRLTVLLPESLQGHRTQSLLHQLLLFRREIRIWK